MDLHAIMDEQVDVYAENEKFSCLLNKYYNDRNSKATLNEMWLIMFRTSCNILKGRFGKYWTWQEISDKAIDMVSLVMGRIQDVEKYPDGYVILNLPTMMKFALINCVYGPKVRKNDAEDSFENIDEFYNIAYTEEDGTFTLVKDL